MRLLLDTHIYLWVLKGDRKLSKAAQALIQNASEVYISSISIWEAAIKAKLGKLDVDIDKLIGAISLSGFSELPLTTKHIVEFDRLPNLHHDPFDRILIAQAISEPLRLLTANKILKNYSELVEIT
ncbi:MAG: type II toxin-antitoxin system VapC family toxin [Rickettsia endosymbiont of Ixodes persulcatus]|nr:type II toxin-antitoxin system VapC family toxin [Rickettsia endosymbiont of Ixodes persulcatus]